MVGKKDTIEFSETIKRPVDEIINIPILFVLCFVILTSISISVVYADVFLTVAILICIFPIIALNIAHICRSDLRSIGYTPLKYGSLLHSNIAFYFIWSIVYYQRIYPQFLPYILTVNLVLILIIYKYSLLFSTEINKIQHPYVGFPVYYHTQGSYISDVESIAEEN